MSTPPPQDPTQVYQQPGGQPPYQAPPPGQQGSGGGNPWPWVFGAVALIVAGGGRVEDPLETQAAWLHAELTGRGADAIAAALATSASKP